MAKQELTISSQNEMWQDVKQLQEIKKIYGEDLSDGEFTTLCQIGQATNLNPFLREIWAVKYGNNPASIFIGRDGYRKASQEHPDYNWHQVDAVYENDSYDVIDGNPKHKYNVKNRGKLVGAYCIVNKKSTDRVTYLYVDFKEYSTGKSLWQSKPATMIKKVAEAQGLRMAFQGMFSGTYDESEQWEDKNPDRQKQPLSNKKTATAPQINKIEKTWIKFWDLLCELKGNEADEQGELRYTPEKSTYTKTQTIKAYFGKEDVKKLTKIEADQVIARIEEKLKILEQEKISWEKQEGQSQEIKIKYAVVDENDKWNVYDEDTAKILKGGFSTKKEAENWVKIQQQARGINKKKND